MFVAHHAQIHNSHIGNHSSIGRYDEINDATIGRYCTFSWDVTIGAPPHPMNTITACGLANRKEYGIVYFDAELPQKRTVVGNDVWIGCNTTVIDGCQIGDGAIIGAGAVVTTDIPAYEIWGGVPARKIRSRFGDEIIGILEEIKWWNWSTDKIASMMDLFTVDLTIDVVKEIYKRHIEHCD